MVLKFTRYLLREVLPLYLVGCVVFTILMTTDLLSSTVGVMLRNRTPLDQALLMFALRMPDFVSKALPVAVPFAILLGLGRLAKDSELKVMFTSGITPSRMLAPLLVLGAVISGVLFFLDANVRPLANAKWWDTINIVYNGAPPPKEEQLFTQIQKGVLYSAGSIRQNTQDSAQLSGVMVRTPEGTYTAMGGTWDSRQQTWELFSVWKVAGAGAAPVFEPRKTFPYTGKLVEFTPLPEYLSIPDIQRKLRSGNLTLETEHSLRFELQRRFAEPLAALCFAFAASALGLLLRDRSWAFIGVILLIFVYYVLWSYTPELAKVGALPVWIAAWLPDGVFLVLGASLLRRLT
ncbi:LptF/LptG family permease [Deinococcus roseus]|uniref:Permease n=1 Tax=Deinococcus roseus TaxID=392414 RepID=A0ABQ2D3W3_9DEIO|nr:LptF/LptG family permease [Deinococcus roseus]GGJ41303.1 permease [Deinococcus roseus]